VNIIKKWHSFKPAMDKQLPSEDREQFKLEQNTTNIMVLKIFGWITVVCALGLIIITNISVPSFESLVIARGHLYRNYLYFIIIIVQAIFLGLIRFFEPHSNKGNITNYFSWLLIADVCFLLLWGAALSGIDQLIHGDIAVYILGCYAIAVSTRFYPMQYVVIFGVSLIGFIMGVSVFQANPERLVAHYINGTILVILAFVTTNILFGIRIREFITRTKLEKQKQEMELRVQERTADLFIANEELKAEITERKAAQDRLIYLSHHDSLTGLYNRNFFEEEMRRLEIERNPRVGLLVCDVDGLKLINDSMGHDQGDNLLITAAQLISQCFERSGAMVARVGRKEFAVLFPAIGKAALEVA